MRRNPEEIIVDVKQLKIGCNNKKKWQRSKTSVTFLNADKHSPASSARSDCVHEQVAKRIANVRFIAAKHSNALHRAMPEKIERVL